MQCRRENVYIVQVTGSNFGDIYFFTKIAFINTLSFVKLNDTLLNA